MAKAANFRRLSPKCFVAATLVMTIAACASDALAHDATADYERLIEEKAPSLVTVKFVLKIKSQWGDHDAESEATGVIITPDGLVMCANSHFGGGAWLARSGATAVPTDIKILIGDDTEGLEATVIARDTDLDLAWLKLKKPIDKKLPAIDLTKTATPKIGDRLYLVNRLAKYFDRTPVVMETQMGGVTSKPRPLYIPTGGSGAMGLPVFNAEGVVVGISITQAPGEEEMEASGSYMGGSVVILPAENAHKATQRALATMSDEEDEGEEADKGAEKGEASDEE